MNKAGFETLAKSVTQMMVDEYGGEMSDDLQQWIMEWLIAYCRKQGLDDMGDSCLLLDRLVEDCSVDGYVAEDRKARGGWFWAGDSGSSKSWTPPKREDDPN